MPTEIKSTIHSEVARTFYNSVLNKTNRAYFTLGRLESWPDELAPPQPSSSASAEIEVRNRIVRYVSVTSANVSLLAERYNWLSGTVYDMYNPFDDNLDIPNARMFVLTDDFNIYKCIFNNYGAQSTVKPTGTSTDYIELADGYVWKFMKTLTILERNRYLTTSSMPVSDVIEGAARTAEVDFVLNSGGSGYVIDNTVLSVDGDGTGALLTPIITGGVITDVVIENAGSGYSTAEIIVTTPDPAKDQGVGADIDAVLVPISLDTPQSAVQLAAVDGEISAVYITDGGAGYTNAAVTITGDGINASATATITNGTITAINFLNRGKDYTFAEVTVTGDGTGFASYVIIAPPGGHGFSLVAESYPKSIGLFLGDINPPIKGMETPNIDYRQVCLVINPTVFNSPSLYGGDSGTPAWLIEDSNIVAANFTPGTALYKQGTDIKMYVVAVEDGKLLVNILSAYTPADGDVLVDETPTTVLTINTSTTTTLTQPDIDVTSGSLLYIDNRAPFRKDITQIANIRTVITF
jgi:hypothetical protein